MKRGRLFKSSLFFSWIVSYMLLIAITLIITSSVYLVAINVIEDNINKLNGSLLKEIKTNLDSTLDNTETLASQIVLNSNVSIKMYESINRYVPDKLINVKLMKDFISYGTTHGYVDYFYLYFKDNDTVYTQNSIYDSETFYKIGDYNNDLSYKGWKEFQSSKHSREIIPYIMKDKSQNYVKTLAYVQSIPLTGPVAGNITIILKEDVLSKAFKNIQWDNNGLTFIIDRNNNVFSSGESLKLPETIVYDKLIQEGKLSRHIINGEEYVVSFISSDTAPWKYVSMIPVNSYKGQLTKIQILIGLAAFLCLLFGGTAAYYFSKRNYIHVNELVNILNKDTYDKDEEPVKINEFSFIKSAVVNTINEKTIISNKLREQKSVLRRDFLTRLLKGRLGSQISIEDMMLSSGISFISDKFAVVLFCIEDSENFFTSMDDAKYADQFLLAQFIVRNVVEELADRIHRGFVVEVDELAAFIVNFNEQDSDNYGEDVLKIIHDAQEFINEKFSIPFTISVSNVHQTITGIHAAYEEALIAMEYKMVLGSGGIIKFEDIKTPQSFYYYPLEVEHQLMNYIKIGDYDLSMELLEDILKKNFIKPQQSLQTAKCLMFNLISTMIKTMDALNIMNEQSFIEDINPVDVLAGCKTIEEMKQKLFIILRKICRFINGKKQSSNIHLRDEIISYISENYYDMNLSITMLSEVFNMNPLYLSRFFKEQSGESLVDHINRTRLEKAKLFLGNEKTSIEDIARKVGFNNIVSFIRVFKKYEGITPGKYRDIK